MKIAIIGYGKMGKTIERLAIQQGDEVVLKIGSNNAAELNRENLRKADVAIEFSRPESAFSNIKMCLEAGIPIVSGTTGWLDKKPEIEELCTQKGGAFIYASNFSIGVNLFFALNQYLARLMNDHQNYRPEMEEIHHTQKLDAPSGTAISLAEQIIEQRSDLKSWLNESAPNKDQLSIISKRIDKVPGTHTIQYKSDMDSIEIKHTAHSREGFASGSLLAAKWLIGKKGNFTMSEVLGL